VRVWSIWKYRAIYLSFNKERRGPRDLYQFPKQGNTIYDSSVEKLVSGWEKVLLLEQKLAERIDHRNFIPYVQLHEYEALLLAKPDSFSHFYIRVFVV
jgi:Domain of unknown function (DUF4276)